MCKQLLTKDNNFWGKPIENSEAHISFKLPKKPCLQIQRLCATNGNEDKSLLKSLMFNV